MTKEYNLYRMNKINHFMGGIISMCERNMTASGHISPLILP